MDKFQYQTLLDLYDMIQTLEAQQAQFQFLANSKKLRDKNTKLQYDRCISDINTFQFEIAQIINKLEHTVDIPEGDTKAQISDCECATYRDGFSHDFRKRCGQKGCRTLKRKWDEASDISCTKDNFSTIEPQFKVRKIKCVYH